MADEAWAKGQKKREELFGVEGGGRLDLIQKFDEGFAKILNNVCFGEVWSRPGLPRPTRSLVTVAMLVALRQHDELRLHLRGALRNGVTRAELNELLLQAVVYCGAPAAHSAYKVLEEVLAEGAP